MSIINDPMKRLITALGRMSYNESNLITSKQELQVELILTTLGFKKSPSIRAGWWFEYQPNGKQCPPDFRVYFNDRHINLECKSSRNGFKPMWNCSIPQSDTVYVHSNQSRDKTLVVSGSDIVPPPLRGILEEYKNKSRQLAEETNYILKNMAPEENPYQITVYPRMMFQQTLNFDPSNEEVYLYNAIKSSQKAIYNRDN